MFLSNTSTDDVHIDFFHCTGISVGEDNTSSQHSLFSIAMKSKDRDKYDDFEEEKRERERRKEMISCSSLPRS